MIINCNWSIALCNNCNQSIITGGPDEVSICSYTVPMSVFHTSAEGYINWEHLPILIIVKLIKIINKPYNMSFPTINTSNQAHD